MNFFVLYSKNAVLVKLFFFIICFFHRLINCLLQALNQRAEKSFNLLWLTNLLEKEKINCSSGSENETGDLVNLIVVNRAIGTVA